MAAFNTPFRVQKNFTGWLNLHPPGASKTKKQETMKTINLLSFRGIVISFLFFISCSDSEMQTTISDQEEVELISAAASHDAIVETELHFADEIAVEAGNGRLSAGCADVTLDETSKTITVDFGSGCTGPFGTNRSGKIIIAYEGKFQDKLANRSVTFYDYAVRDKQITGSVTIRDFSVDELGNPTFTRDHTDLRITFAGGSYVVSNGTVTISWISGFADGDLSNNILQVTGSSDGISSRGRKVIRHITEPLVINSGCLDEGGFATVSGRMEVTIDGIRKDRKRVLEFGNGECDKVITVSTGERSYTVELN